VEKVAMKAAVAAVVKEAVVVKAAAVETPVGGKVAGVRDEKDRNRQINMRLNRYRNQVQEAAQGMKNEPLGEKTEAFLADPDPTAQRLEKLAGELAGGLKKARKPKRDKLMVLVSSMADYWLDKCSLKEGVETAADWLKKALEKAGFAADDVVGLVRQWDPGGLF
jgi:hypothetical protein